MWEQSMLPISYFHIVHGDLGLKGKQCPVGTCQTASIKSEVACLEISVTPSVEEIIPLVIYAICHFICH